MKRPFLSFILLIASMCALAQTVPTSYYSRIDGKQKESLKLELGKILKNHTKRSYDDLKTDYKKVYVVTGTKEQVYDLYSAEKYNYSSGGWNREHTIANSWWGGTKNNAYSDLFSVIPSEINANSRKSNYPPAELTNNVKYDSGRIKVGSPKSGMGGGFGNCWEPYDEFKGDFARIIFYVVTCYDDIAWGQSSSSKCIQKETWPTLQPWLYEMLLRWHNADPVNDKEIEINEAVYQIQKNRNPFVDYPILADYIWGELTTSAFNISDVEPHQHYNGNIPSASFEVDPTAIDFGTVDINDTPTATITVTPKGLTSDLKLTTTIGELSASVISKTTTKPVDIRLTFKPSAVGTQTGKVTITDGESTKVISVTAEVFDGSSPILGLSGTFAKVTEEPQDWSGIYLLVYENEKGALVLDGSLDNFDGANKSVSATVVGNKITSDGVKYIDHSFEIKRYQDGYTIKSNSGYFLGTTDHKKLVASNSTPYKHDISLAADGSAEITIESKYLLRYNTSANMFRYYSSGQEPIYLYKAEPLVNSIEHTVEATSNPCDNYTYSLSGQRVTSNYKGIAIRNGKKILMR